MPYSLKNKIENKTNLSIYKEKEELELFYKDYSVAFFTLDTENIEKRLNKRKTNSLHER